MEFFCVAGGPLGRLVSPHSSLRVLLLVTAQILLVSGQSQVGVSLRFRGAALPNDSIVDLDDVMYTEPSGPESDLPSNTNPRDEAVLCVTDLEDCCDASRTERGNWYLPDGTRVGLGGDGAAFQANRGPNEVIDGQTFYGSVRLYRRYGGPPERGRFRCELPNAADPSVNQVIYVNILNFASNFRDPHIITASSGSNTAGAVYSLACSSTLNDDSIPLPANVSAPRFVWSFGPSGSDPLPSGITDMGTTSSDNVTFTSTLQFSPLSQSYAGRYTCRLGPARLVNNVMITVNDPPISAVVTANLNNPVMVGQTDHTLTCDISGAEGLTDRTITYQWTRNGETIQSGSSNTFDFSSPLQLSLAGQGGYACSATVGSNLLNANIEASSAETTQTVMIQIPDPQSVTLTASSDNILNGSLVTVNCSVVLNSIREEDLSLLNVSAQIFRNGTILTQTSQSVDGTTFNFGATVNSFTQSNVGSYNCTATVSPAPSSQFLTGTGQGTSPLVRLTIGIPPPPSPPPSPRGGGSQAGAIAGGVIVIVALAAVGVAVVALLFWFKKPSHYKSTSDATTGDVHPGEDIYEDPDRTAASTTPGSFKLTECPAYVTTTASSPQPNIETQLQNGYYEL